MPLIVGGSDGNKYVVKPSGSGEGLLSNVSEWLAIRLGRMLQIPVLEPVFLMIDDGFAEEAGDPEIIELLEKSAGINFGTRYLENVSAFNERNARRVDASLKRNIFLYDLFLLNIDRTSGNPNMIFDGDELFCLDFSSSITMRSSIDGRDYREQAFLRHIKNHPFYGDDTNADEFIKRVKAIGDKSIRDIIDELPGEWMRKLRPGRDAVEARRGIGDRLIDKKNGANSLTLRLEELRTLEIETEEERKLRILKNKEEFERRFGKL